MVWKLVFVSALAFGSATSANAQSMAVSFDTTPAGGNYAPRNIVAVWVEAADGTFIKTIGRWSDRRTQHLVDWVSASGLDTDAVSGATRSDHNDTLQVIWDLADRAGQPVPDGDYVVRMELADRNSTTPDQNNQGAFAVTLDGTATTNTASGGGFDNVSIELSLEPPPDTPDDPSDPSDPAGSDAGPDDGTIGNIEGGCNAGGPAGFASAFFILLASLASRRKRPLAVRRTDR